MGVRRREGGREGVEGREVVTEGRAGKLLSVSLQQISPQSLLVQIGSK